MTSTALAVQADIVKALAEHRIDLNEALTQAADPIPTTAPKALPKVIAISQEEKKTLRSLPSAIANAELPDKARELSEAEKQEFVPLFDQIKVAKAALVKAEDALKEAFHNHLDVEFLATGPKGVIYDTHNHIAEAGQVVAEGYARKVVREERGGKSSLTVDAVKSLLADGKITKEQYDLMVDEMPVPPVEATTVEVLNENGIMAAIGMDPKLLAKLAKVAPVSPKSTAINMRKNG